MRTKRAPIRSRPALALAGAAVLVELALGPRPVRAAPRSQGSQTIKSGAGPGWPKTCTNDFVARVDNPRFPLKPGSRWHYRGVDEDGRFADNMHVTHRTKRIEGVRTTVVHDVVLKHGKPREVTNDWYAQDHHGTSGTSARTRRNSTGTAT